MILRAMTVVLAGLLLAVAGCSTDTEMGGVRIPNANPDTRITGQPPTLLEAGFSVRFYWTGTDADGKIAGYQWKITDNGVDGISPRDSLTVDPLTGAEINPWHFTTATDSTYVVLADQAGFPGDNPDDPRSYRSHSLFVRAVDNNGAVDPSPAFISFTSTTIVPTARVEYPRLDSREAQRVPSTVNIGWNGYDEDYARHTPTRVRYLWRDSVAPDGTVILVKDQYERWYDEMIQFDSPEWSAWKRYLPDEIDRQVSFQRRNIGDFFMFAVQVQDTAGAVSVGRAYQQQVAHVFIAEGFQPAITMREVFLEVIQHDSDHDIAAGQPLNFSWSVDPSAYNGKLVSMQHGWDLLSGDDPADDPRWSVPPGLSEQNRYATERTFQEGAHTFWLRVVDDSQQVTVYKANLEVIQYVDYDLQAQLRVIDQVVDGNIQAWPDCNGLWRDHSEHRDAFWRFLESGPGGIDGLIWDEDHFDDGDQVSYADLVGFKAVLCFARAGETQTMFSQFRAVRKADKFVWLTPYQQRGGNLFLIGSNSMYSFIEDRAVQYMVPMVFVTNEVNWVSPTGSSYTVGFGTKELTDGTEVSRGPLMYPYAIAGVSFLDWTSPSNKNIYAISRTAANLQRRTNCVGLKGMVLDPGFKSFHSIGPGVVADTIMTDPCIDWGDGRLENQGRLAIATVNFNWGDDEFIDANISSRVATPAPQTCNDPVAPDDACIEPMFRGLARFDWLRDHKRSRGEPDWPPYEAEALDDTCGAMALTSYLTDDGELLPRGSALTNNRVYGYFSYKMAGDKPSRAADVYWGFDPYRFDQAKMKNAIRWVLGDHFGLQVVPSTPGG